MLTARHIADRLRVSRQCVYTLIEERLLPASRVSEAGRAIRVRPEDLNEFLEKCKVPKRSKSPPKRTVSAPSAFTHLDGIKLRKAWAEKGIFPHG